MSALIKSAATATVRPFSRPCPTAVSPAGPQLDPHVQERAALMLRIEELEQALSDARGATVKAAQVAREEGLAEGAAAAARRDEERIALLEAGIARAADAFGERLALLDALAPLLARAALEKLFGAQDRWGDLLEPMLRHQLGRLERGAILTVQVSAEDYPDAERLALLSDSLGAPRLRIEAVPDLAAGTCRIECRMGGIDLCARSQWAELAALLDSIAAEETPRC